jgi:cytochrome bd ubiquinol oxidase subunit II
MTLADVLIGVVWLGVTAYAVLGGADFGAGVLHLLAPPGLAGRRHRRAVVTAIGPVWEANHVWLIFVLTGLFTIFPPAFSALGSALLLPATLALLGIVVRGASLAFASQLTAADRLLRPLQILFGVASAVTPLLFGFIAGGLARERLVLDGRAARSGGGLALWIGPFQLVVGLLAVAVCVALAATFLTVETGGFRRAATLATAATCGLAVAAFGLAAWLAPPLFRGLTGRGLPAVVAGLVALVMTLAALRRGRDRLARATIAAATAALIWGWGLAQFPHLVGSKITVAGAAAPAPELHAIAVALAAGAALLLPSLWLLYGAFRRYPGHPAR